MRCHQLRWFVGSGPDRVGAREVGPPQKSLEVSNPANSGESSRAPLRGEGEMIQGESAASGSTGKKPGCRVRS